MSNVNELSYACTSYAGRQNGMETSKRPWAKDGALFVPTSYKLPRRCLRCGGTNGLASRSEVLHKFPMPLTLILMVLAIGPGFLIGLWLSKKASFRYSICQKCRDISSKAARNIGIVVILGFAGLWFVPAAWINGAPVIGAVLGIVVGGAILFFLRRNYLSGDKLRLALVEPELVRARGAHVSFTDPERGDSESVSDPP